MAAAPASSSARLPRVGEVVVVSGHKGIVRFVGVTEFASGVWVGIELEVPKGKNNGTVKDVTYFTCEPDYGIFVRPRAVEFLDVSEDAAQRVQQVTKKDVCEETSEAAKQNKEEEDVEKKKAEEEAVRRKLQEEAAKKKAHEDEVAKSKQKEDVAKKQAEEEAARKKALEEEQKVAKSKQKEESVKKKAEDEPTKKTPREESAKKAPTEDKAARSRPKEEIAKKKAEDEAAKKKPVDAEAAKKKTKEEVANKAEEEATRKKPMEEQPSKIKSREELPKKKAEEEGPKKKIQEETTTKKLTEEETAKRKPREEAAKKRTVEEATKKKADEDSSKKKQIEETAKKRPVEEDAVKKKQREEAARKRAEDEAAKKKLPEEAAKKKVTDEDVAKRKQREEVARKRVEDEAVKKKPGEARAAPAAKKRPPDSEAVAMPKTAAVGAAVKKKLDGEVAATPKMEEETAAVKSRATEEIEKAALMEPKTVEEAAEHADRRPAAEAAQQEEGEEGEEGKAAQAALSTKAHEEATEVVKAETDVREPGVSTLREEQAERQAVEEVSEKQLQEDAAKTTAEEEAAKTMAEEEAAKTTSEEESDTTGGQTKEVAQEKVREKSAEEAEADVLDEAARMKGIEEEGTASAETLMTETQNIEGVVEVVDRRLKDVEAAVHQEAEDEEETAQETAKADEATEAADNEAEGDKPETDGRKPKGEFALQETEEDSANQQEEDTIQRKAEDEEVAQREEVEEVSQRKAEEEAAKAEEEEAELDEEAAKGLVGEDAAKRKAEEEGARQKGEEEVAQMKAEEEAAQRKAEEEAAQKKAEEEAAQKKASEDVAKKKAEDEAAKRKAEEEEEEDAKQKAEEEEAAKRKAEEEAAKRKAEEEAAKRKAEEEAAKKKAQEAEAVAKKRAEEEATTRLKKADAEAAATKKRASEEAARMKRKANEIERLKAALQLEKGKLELAKLQVEEAEVLLTEARESMSDGPDQKDERTESTEEEQLALYQRAIVKLYDDHACTVKQLKRRITELEKVETQLKKGVEVKDDSLQQSIEQLSNQNGALELNVKLTTAALSERRKLCADADEAAVVHAELEEALVEELQHQEERERQLKLLARSLAHGRERLNRSREEEAAKTAKIEVRLRTVQRHRKPSPDEESKLPESIEESKLHEFESMIREADASAARARAELCAQCIPRDLIQDSALGPGFQCLLALQRMARKAEILSTSIMQHYVEDASMLAQSMDQLPMLWLCGASFAGAQCAFAAAGIAGRLLACEAHESTALLSSPALRGCVAGEVHVDSALAAVPLVCAVREPTPSIHDQALAQLCASSAQLVSILRSVFKDHGFASWQTAEHAVRAVEAVCATALFASSDAGGTRRSKWQGLFDFSWALRADVAHSRGKQSQNPRAFEDYIEPSIPLVDGPEDVDLSPSDVSSPLSSNNHPRASVATGLTPSLVDALLVQATMLQQYTLCEPPHSGAAADTLDRTLTHAETSLASLKAALANRLQQSQHMEQEPSKVSLSSTWQQQRDDMRDKIEKAERHTVERVAEIEKELLVVNAQLEEVEAKSNNEKMKTADVERHYSEVRMAAEQGRLVDEDLRRLKRHAALHAHRLEELQNMLEKEQDAQKQAETNTVAMEEQCTELQEQLARLEGRLQRKYMHAHMAPDDVIALELRNAAQEVKLQNLHASPRAQLPMLNFVATEGMAAAFHSCSQEAAGIRTKLLMEQAKTVLVDLEQREPATVVSSELPGLADRSAALRADVTSLLRDVSGLRALDSSTQVRAAVGLTRHLQSTAVAPKSGAACAMRFELPTPKLGKMVAVHALQLLGDSQDLEALHRAVF